MATTLPSGPRTIRALGLLWRYSATAWSLTSGPLEWSCGGCWGANTGSGSGGSSWECLPGVGGTAARRS